MFIIIVMYCFLLNIVWNCTKIQIYFSLNESVVCCVFIFMTLCFPNFSQQHKTCVVPFLSLM